MKLKIAFICVHNSCRSQMAEAWAKKLASDILEVYSAGTEQYKEVKPKAVEAMELIKIDMDDHYPKLLKDIPEELDILITMGCNVVCPFIPNRHMEDWGLEDPSGGSLEDFIKCRDLIKYKVEELIIKIKSNTLFEK